MPKVPDSAKAADLAGLRVGKDSPAKSSGCCHSCSRVAGKRNGASHPTDGEEASLYSPAKQLGQKLDPQVTSLPAPAQAW